MSSATPITVETTVNMPAEKAWMFWTEPQHITQWCSGSADWHTPKATNDLKEGGTFSTRMEAKDGSIGFDFGGTYTKVVPHSEIAYTMGDGRKVAIHFAEKDGATHITQTFDPESENPAEMQRAGWQNIMDNFKAYAEGK